MRLKEEKKRKKEEDMNEGPPDPQGLLQHGGPPLGGCSRKKRGKTREIEVIKQ